MTQREYRAGEWTPCAGDLVQEPHGHWGVLHGDRLDGWLCAGWHIRGTSGNGGDPAKCKLLCPAADSLDACWAALKSIPWLVVNHAFYSLHLETGRLVFTAPLVTVEYQTYVANTCMAKVTTNTLAAHLRDMQKFQALCEYIKRCGAAKEQV